MTTIKRTVHEQLVEIQKNLKVTKSHRNTFGGYNYRNSEDILEAVKPLLGDCTLVIDDEIVVIGDRYYVKATATLRSGEQWITSHGYAREADEKKGMDVSQVTGATSSYARKYALNGLFAIDDARDADSQDNREKPQQKEHVDYGKKVEDTTPKPVQETLVSDSSYSKDSKAMLGMKVKELMDKGKIEKNYAQISKMTREELVEVLENTNG